MSNPQLSSPEVLIVGAGLAGLIAGRELIRAGIPTRLLEACEYPGGRTLDHPSALGYRFPLGATYLGPDEEALTALLQELGIKTTPQYETGEIVLRLNGTQQNYRGEEDNIVRVGPLPIPRQVLSEAFLQILARLDQLCAQVPLAQPQAAPRAAEWDAMTLGDWCRQNIPNPDDHAMFRIMMEGEMGAELDELSFLYYLFIRRAMLNYMIDDRILQGGTQQICLKLAEQIASQIHYQTIVEKIEQTRDGVQVRTDKGTFHAHFVIVTVPPKPALDIILEPPMPPARAEMLAATSLSEIMKCFAIYATPFWREQGSSGLALSDEGPLNAVFDCTPVPGTHGALMGFISHRDARHWSQVSEQERRDAVIRQLIEFFGPDAAHPLEYVDQDWLNFPWAQGAYFPNLPPGILAKHGNQVLREPFGYLHWAGTETESEWTGSMEGAIRSGKRAVQEILERISEAVGKPL